MREKLAPGQKIQEFRPEQVLKYYYDNEAKLVSQLGRTKFETSVNFWKKKLKAK